MSSFWDNFNRADASTLGANWSKDVFLDLTISSRQVRYTQANVDYGFGLWTTTVGGDQYSQATFINLVANDSGTEQWLIVRDQVGTVNWYGAVYRPSQNSHYLIGKYKASVFSILATSSQIPVAGDVVRIEVQGTSPATLTLFIDGIQVAQVTDSDFSSGSMGIATYSSANYNPFENWSGGSLPFAKTTGPFPTSMKDQL